MLLQLILGVLLGDKKSMCRLDFPPMISSTMSPRGYFSLFVVEDPSIWIVNLSFANFRFLIQSILISPSPLCHVLIAHMFSPHTPSPVRCHFTSHLQPYPTPHPLPILHPICQISNVLFQLTFKNELSVSHFGSVRYIGNKLKQWDSPKKGKNL